jgi:hypothetical protein
MPILRRPVVGRGDDRAGGASGIWGRRSGWWQHTRTIPRCCYMPASPTPAGWARDGKHTCTRSGVESREGSSGGRPVQVMLWPGMSLDAWFRRRRPGLIVLPCAEVHQHRGVAEATCPTPPRRRLYPEPTQAVPLSQTAAHPGSRQRRRVCCESACVAGAAPIGERHSQRAASAANGWPRQSVLRRCCPLPIAHCPLPRVAIWHRSCQGVKKT